MYESVSGTLLDVALTVEDAVRVAEWGVLGDGRVSDSLCADDYEVLDDQRLWLHGGRSEDLAVVTYGVVSTGELTSGSSYTRLFYQSFVGPENRFTELMRSVYIPIQSQGLSADTGVSTPITSSR